VQLGVVKEWGVAIILETLDGTLEWREEHIREAEKETFFTCRIMLF